MYWLIDSGKKMDASDSSHGSSQMASNYPLQATSNLCPTREARSALSVAPPVDEVRQDSDEPQDGTGQDDPNGVFHTLNIAVSPSVLVDVQL
jgi:hypothetical protein